MPCVCDLATCETHCACACSVSTAEMMCLESAGRLPLSDYRRATMYTTLSPCSMCAGAVLHYQIPRVVIADSEHFQGEEVRCCTALLVALAALS